MWSGGRSCIGCAGGGLRSLCYNFHMNIDCLKSWLGTGSVNIFGLPMSGKDTVGQRLAEMIGAKFLSSGEIIREMEAEGASGAGAIEGERSGAGAGAVGSGDSAGETSANGKLIPSDLFYDWVLPYFERPELKGFPLVLSSIGRWAGEEEKVMAAAEKAGHPIKAAVFLEISRDEALKRWRTVQEQGAREVQGAEARLDDYDLSVFEKRIAEFEEKTVPVLDAYREKGLLVAVSGVGTRDEVFEAVVSAIVQKTL